MSTKVYKRVEIVFTLDAEPIKRIYGELNKIVDAVREIQDELESLKVATREVDK